MPPDDEWIDVPVEGAEAEGAVIRVRKSHANNDEGFRIQNLVSNNSPKGPSWKAAKPDIINSMEKERIVEAIQQKYWSNKDKDGLSSARQLSKEE